MEIPSRVCDVSAGPSRRQHRSTHSASFRRTSHTSDMIPPARDPSRQASLRLDFIIVGGGKSWSHVPDTICLTINRYSGIAGLSAAYALAASGHRVRLFEQARGLDRQHGGIRLPPSATRILRHWGVEKEIAQKASSTTSSAILDSECHKHWLYARSRRGDADWPGFCVRK
jgi:hypothetical protein